MPRGHLSCRACRIRLRTDSPAIAVLGNRCPNCGASLTAVASPSDVVGFRSFDLGALFEKEPDQKPDAAVFPAGRETASAREAQDAGRWCDDGGSAAGEAVARWPAPQ